MDVIAQYAELTKRVDALYSLMTNIDNNRKQFIEQLGEFVNISKPYFEHLKVMLSEIRKKVSNSKGGVKEELLTELSLVDGPVQLSFGHLRAADKFFPEQKKLFTDLSEVWFLQLNCFELLTECRTLIR